MNIGEIEKQFIVDINGIERNYQGLLEKKQKDYTEGRLIAVGRNRKADFRQLEERRDRAILECVGVFSMKTGVRSN